MKSGIVMIARRSLRHHFVSTAVSVLSVGLACGLLMSVTVIQSEAFRAFTAGPLGFDAVLGARGSALQLVLNSVFHLETSSGNIPWTLYETVRADPRVTKAIPYAVGDNYQGFRIVGTTSEIFTTPFARGRAFAPESREAVVGAFAAERAGLDVGSVFQPYHGLVFNESMRHEDDYTVVGILAPTGTPADRVVWIPIDGIFRMEGHVLRGGGTEFKAEPGVMIPDEYKEASAVMIQLRNPQAGFMLDREINKQGKVATLAWPIGKVMADLFGKMGWGVRILQVVAALIGVVAAGSILASVYNTIRERRREFAILRALGARRRTIFGIVILESTAIAALGSVFGFAVHGVVLAGAAHFIRAETGIILDVLQWHPIMLFAPLGMIGLGILAGLVPAARAYSTDVGSNLAPHS